MTDSPAIRHSLIRLEKVRQALTRLEAAKTFDDAESAWTDILLFGNGVYSKLEQGSKANGRAAAWFGRAKKARKDDQLLSYMHHARNSEEHGVEDITARHFAGEAQITITDEALEKIKTEGLVVEINLTSAGHVHVKSSNEKALPTKMFHETGIALVAVNDPRFNDRFEPPQVHLGHELADKTPLAVSRLFVDYLANLIDEARGYGV